MGKIIDIEAWKSCKALGFFQNADIKFDAADDDDEYSIDDDFRTMILFLLSLRY